jgi:uncharacterized protein (DUF3820 family)
MSTPKKLTLSTKVPFGKYKGQLVYDLIREDCPYIKWLINIWKGEIDYKVTEWVKLTNK